MCIQTPAEAKQSEVPLSGRIIMFHQPESSSNQYILGIIYVYGHPLFIVHHSDPIAGQHTLLRYMDLLSLFQLVF